MVLGWTLTFLVVGGGLLWVLWPIFSVLFASAALAYLLDPVIDRFEAAGWGRTRAIGVSLTLFLLAVGIRLLIFG